MSLEIAWKQNILVTDSNLLKSLLVVFGFGSQAFVCGFSRQNINSVVRAQVIPVILCSECNASFKQRTMKNSNATLENISIHCGTFVFSAFSIPVEVSKKDYKNICSGLQSDL